MNLLIHNELDNLITTAWKLSRELHGRDLEVFVPGMFSVNGVRGRYHAVSLTGRYCRLQCEHCKGRLLAGIPSVNTPEALVEYGRKAWDNGHAGLLLTGGADIHGRLPWHRFGSAVRALKRDTGLKLSAHVGMLDLDAAGLLRDAGLDQALVDVIGSDATTATVYHTENGMERIRKTLDSLAHVGLEIVPHIVCGLHFGRFLGEYTALETLADYDISKYIIVGLMPDKHTPMAGVTPPPVKEIARFIAHARIRLPHVRCGLGCARVRGAYSRGLESLALRAGVNSIALASDNVIKEAEAVGMNIIRKQTCCSW